jgi:uncharacterized C2H2 Zn-finger protein
MSELENAEVNRQLCAVAADEMFDSWSPETQEQILAEWNDWRQDENPGHCCDHCEKVFTRRADLKRHMQSLHSGEKSFTCGQCDNSFATKDKLNRHKKIIPKRRPSNVQDVTRNLIERCVITTAIFLTEI